MVALNFSRTIEKKAFVNFHDKRPQGRDYKIRYAFRDTEFYGAYMTDIIKDFEEKISGNVLQYLRENKDFELMNVKLFEQEISDLKCSKPLIIAFGNITFDILNKHLGKNTKYTIIKVMHYSQRINKENYKTKVWTAIQEQKNAGKIMQIEIDQIWNGFCPESLLKNKTVRMRLNKNDFYESEETGLQIAVLSGVQAIIMNFRGKGRFRIEPKYADEIENGEIFSPQNTEKSPFNNPTEVFKESEQIINYIKNIV